MTFAGSVLKGLVHGAVDFLYPRVCPLCRREDGRGRDVPIAQPVFCSECDGHFPIQETRCPRCSAPAGPYLDTSNGCIHCRKDRFAFETVSSIGVYTGLLRRVCLGAKQTGGEALAAAAAALLEDRNRDELHGAGADLAVPVPQHWRRRIFHFNAAAEMVGRRLANSLRIDYATRILIKVRRTPPQSSLPPSRRRRNLQGAFRVRDAETVAGRSILLVDDILTTGATAHEVSRALRQAGAKRIVVAVLARGLGQTTA